MTEWRPILEGAEAEQAREAMTAIAGELASLDLSSDPDLVTLARGAPGVALFLGYLARATDEARWWDAAQLHLDRAFDRAMADPPGPYLFTGLTGLAFAAEQLTAFDGEGGEGDDPHEDIDELVLGILDLPADSLRFELYNGVAGLGVYALERLPRPGARRCLERVVKVLDGIATRSGDGATWFSAPSILPPGDHELFPAGYHSLGVAHGVPGVLAVLAGAIAAGVSRELAASLFADGVRWLWSRRLPEGGPAAFPSLLESPDGIRTAWCYGDPGVAAALAASARAAGDETCLARAFEVARLAARRSVEAVGAVDPMLCHGAAGLGHIFNRIYQAGGDGDTLAAARRWLGAALDLRRVGRGIAGFSAREIDPATGVAREESYPGLLDGVAGVGLALIAATSPLEPAWDRAFLLSLAPPSAFNPRPEPRTR